jgi:LysM repeat protein
MSNPMDHDIGHTIESYRRRRERIGNILIGAVAAVLALVGIVLIIVWVGGPVQIRLPFLSTAAPTPTATFTPSQTPTITPTPSITPTLPTETPSGPTSYIVQAGDVLATIAEKFGVSVVAIMAANPTLTDPSMIFIGQKIEIPAPGATITPTPLPTNLKAGDTITYLVLEGDSLQTIASKFRSTAEDIQRLNQITDANTIYPGTYLKVRYGIATPTPTVVTGTPSPIATSTRTPTTGPTSTRAP